MKKQLLLIVCLCSYLFANAINVTNEFYVNGGATATSAYMYHGICLANESFQPYVNIGYEDYFGGFDLKTWFSLSHWPISKTDINNNYNHTEFYREMDIIVSYIAPMKIAELGFRYFNYLGTYDSKIENSDIVLTLKVGGTEMIPIIVNAEFAVYGTMKNTIYANLGYYGVYKNWVFVPILGYQGCNGSKFNSDFFEVEFTATRTFEVTSDINVNVVMGGAINFIDVENFKYKDNANLWIGAGFNF